MMRTGLFAAVGLLAVLGGCGDGTKPDTVGQRAENSATATPTARATPTPTVTVTAGTGEATAEPATVTPRPGTSPPSPAATPRPRATAGTLHLTATDSGRTVTVRPGTVIVVELSGGPGNFVAPSADNATVLRTDDRSGGYPGDTPAVGRFTAVGPGTANITSSTDAACLHSVPRCMIPQAMFQVTIVVRG